jgi:serine/threonine protein kinase/regulation of enolase protein 1 (concanavalin A-like superfamily)
VSFQAPPPADLLQESHFRLERGPASPLQTCPICEALIDISDQEPLAEIACPACGASQKVRGQIDHFDLEEVAGRGGMGVVYRARDTGLDRHVALKLLRKDHSSDEKLIAQLETEAAITASINHPHVVQVFSTGSDCGRFYLAMELVNRGSLDDLLRIQGRVAESQVLDVGIQIAQGLRAAQQHGLIHRDVKPGNILFGDAHTAKIVDFGLAIFMEDEESVRGEIWGTPYYVAPEKLDNQPEDFRSDIYSLGATLFHALAGRPPFEAESATLVALKHLKSQPVSLQAFAPHVSGSTAYIINRTLHKDPEERYQSYDELIEHLEYARTELMNAAVKPQQRRVVLEDEKQQRALGWVTAAMILLIVGIVGVLVASRSGSNSAPGKNRTAAAAPTEEAVPAVSGIFQQAREQLESGAVAEAAASFQRIAEQQQLSPSDAAWASLQAGLAELAAGRPDEARAAFQQLSARAAALAATDADVAMFFTTAADRLQSRSPIDAAAAAALDRSNHEAIGLLLFGLHNWHLGTPEDAATILRQFRAASPRGVNAWIADLKPVASRQIEELTRFRMLADQLNESTSPDQRLLAAENLQKLTGPLASRVPELLAPFAAEFAEFEKQAALLPPEGVYKLVNRKSGRSLDVASRGMDDSANVQQHDYVGAGNQHWALVPLGAGIYKIVAQHSGKVLDVANSEVGDGANVQQFSSNETDAQRWRLTSLGSGAFKLTSVNSGKVLGVFGGATEDGANVVQWTDTGAEDQQWIITPIGGTAGTWRFLDIGGPSIRGSFSIDDAAGTATLTAAGRDIWDQADSFHFACQKVTGDFELIVQITGLEETDAWAKAGIMIREGLSADARNVFVAATASMGHLQQLRSERAGLSSSVKVGAQPKLTWLKLVRAGNSISGFSSPDGKSWQSITTDTLNLPEAAYVGLAATSHSESVATTATFQNIRVLPSGAK